MFRRIGIIASFTLIILGLTKSWIEIDLNWKIVYLFIALLGAIYPLLTLIIKLETLDMMHLLIDARNKSDQSAKCAQSISSPLQKEILETETKIQYLVESIERLREARLQLSKMKEEEEKLSTEQRLELDLAHQRANDFIKNEQNNLLRLSESLKEFGLDVDLVKNGIKKQHQHHPKKFYLVNQPPAYLSYRPGYIEFDMVGMFYRVLSDDDLGVFEGYAETEEHNPEDKYAIAIYSVKTGSHVGYLKKRQKQVWLQINRLGGKVPAFGYIYIKENGKYDAKVSLFINDIITMGYDLD